MGEGETAAETERVRLLQDREAPRYDRQIAFFERILFKGGREWVCRQAHGRVLELAAGTARNLPYYPADVSITGVELSEPMLAIGALGLRDERVSEDKIEVWRPDAPSAERERREIELHLAVWRAMHAGVATERID